MWPAHPAARGPAAGRPKALRLGFTLQPGMRVGLYGGSFNPAHGGHAHVAETALTRLGLDQVIWLVSPQNPLKPSDDMAGAAERMASAHRWARGPSMRVSDVERRLGSAYTVDTLRRLRARFPAVRFVWIMGADGLASFHRWKGWADILREVPVAVVARPGASLRALSSPAARRFAFARRRSAAAATLPGASPPAWVFLVAPLHFESSTALRKAASV
ncbi:MAG: nicotinate-nucleotide adenylyltransferase [Phenylobacterium sp.]|uniref:nicotinate-nucleotide adenylyltransferase n=1 Tax=Phenylobacterium sp. TaxID=1871053 RepID=UPI002735C09B|nr:nicotinate-nucleotide adenylyltransferase [Phenylobacterium sp.]MDP3174085.1 nicotinate-nucleotide adenylyltransferase [Phenylobacterium sp.]